MTENEIVYKFQANSVELTDLPSRRAKKYILVTRMYPMRTLCCYCAKVAAPKYE